MYMADVTHIHTYTHVYLYICLVYIALPPAGILFGGKRGPPREGLEGGRRVGGSRGGAPPDEGEVY